MSVCEVTEKLLVYGTDMIVISGGEPLNQQRPLVPLLEILASGGVDVEVETNGTRVPCEPLIATGVRFNVSPKLSNSGDAKSLRIVPAALRRLNEVPGTSFKFVCRDEADLDEVASLVRDTEIGPVWVMPEGQTGDEVNKHMRLLADPVIERGWNLTTRLHTLAWGQRRGK